MSTDSKTSSVNHGYELAITPPEEAAGAAYDAMAEALLKPLGIEYSELPMDMASRVLSNGGAVPAASDYVKTHPNCIYVKGPGITPRDIQVLETISFLEQNNKLVFKDGSGVDNNAIAVLRKELRPSESPANMEKFAESVKKLLKTIGSPNAAWRDALAANLARGASDMLAERSLLKPPVYTSQTPLSIAAMPANDTNQSTAIAAADTTVSFSFTPKGGEEEPVESRITKITAGTPLRLFSANKTKVKEWAGKALAGAPKGTQIAHGTKQTVLKTYDTALIDWLQETVNERNMADQIMEAARPKREIPVFGNLLVDDLFARLSTSELTQPTLILSPNQSYAQYVRDVWENIKKNGGFKIPKNSEIVRASSTGDHYKSVEYKAKRAGTLAVKDAQGNVLLKTELAEGDVAMATAMDKARMLYTIKQTLDNARSSKKTNVIFGFDNHDPYYKVAVDLLDSVKGNYSDLNITTMGAAEATAYYLTKGVKDTALLLNNIYGDFATDIEVCGKGTSYSVGSISDGRGVVELGSGGTAPDLITLWKSNGVLMFNPMSFIEGTSFALRFAADRMSDDTQKTQTRAVAKAIESGMYTTLEKGIVLPIIEGNFSKAVNAQYRRVSTHSFLQSVQVEALRTLGAPEATVAAADAQLQKMIALDTAIYAANETYGKRWQAANAAWNNAREKAGKIDPFKPDYSLDLPQETDTATLTGEKLMALQEARAALTDSLNDVAAKQVLKNAFVDIGVPAHQAEQLAQNEASVKPKVALAS